MKSSGKQGIQLVKRAGKQGIQLVKRSGKQGIQLVKRARKQGTQLVKRAGKQGIQLVKSAGKSHHMKLLTNRNVPNYNTQNRDNLRLPRTWGKQRSNYQVIRDCYDLNREIRNDRNSNSILTLFLVTYLIFICFFFKSSPGLF